MGLLPLSAGVCAVLMINYSFVFPTRFQFEDVAKACCDFLVKHLEPGNVIGIARFAEEIGCTELNQHSREYINTHFSEVRRKYGKTHSLECRF